MCCASATLRAPRRDVARGPFEPNSLVHVPLSSTGGALVADSPVQFADCTLRDGEQTPGVFFTLEEKLAIADLLDAAGVDILDAGMPSVSKEEQRTLEALLDRGYRATIAATVRALRDEIDLAMACGLKEVFLFIPYSPPH